MLYTILCTVLKEDIALGLAGSLVWYTGNHVHNTTEKTRVSVHQFIEDGSNVVHQSGPFMNGSFTVAKTSAFQLFCKY